MNSVTPETKNKTDVKLTSKTDAMALAPTPKKLEIFSPKKIPLSELDFAQTLLDFKDIAEVSEEDFATWLLPLQVMINTNSKNLILLAPNAFVLDNIKQRFADKLVTYLTELCEDKINCDFKVGSKKELERVAKEKTLAQTKSQTINEKQLEQANKLFGAERANAFTKSRTPTKPGEQYCHLNNLNANFNFDTFVEGKSNQLARAAAQQIAANPGKAYNPLLIYGGVGLGKTHLMHAIGNTIAKNFNQTKILYLHSERFVADMVKALQHNVIDDFKRFYRSLDALLIDDIQFFAGKERSQEEFFHTFNALFEGQQQIILTCDRYPKEINGMEERLKSRFGWGLTVAIEPPELETRVAILMSKAECSNIVLPSEVAFFIAKHIQSNVRELEGALKRVIANAHFTGQPITLNFAREALKDLLAMRAKLVTIDNIQKTVAEYFKIKMVDLLSKRRNRALARPRQIAMTLAKELTNHSLPEIADAFGGRDHATVLHACKTIHKLCQENFTIAEDYRNLLRILSG